MESFEVQDQRKENLAQRKEAAAITQKLLDAASQDSSNKGGGKIVNAYGQEEVGISRREARQSQLRDMYSQSTEKAVSIQKRVPKKEERNKAYVPRAFNESKYEMGQCWGLSSSMPKHVKPLPKRSKDPMQRRVPVPCLPPDEPRGNWLDRSAPKQAPLSAKQAKKD
eukprot:CAMPEP_0179463614 /NCGR_PEP_ID=MMETSP0799-20121207/45636_1 /TAXON_ID=46947 /ORGANISM="Geminigera cryophila, Strain CCMP2564" /LENGTH=166 /DNA_ID=CAMNT_0021266985 /DNA_START=40 /DNA_END=537 /DNA_ORIENTATION=-